jgi:GMP synthase-like glutamine amidotransferase
VPTTKRFLVFQHIPWERPGQFLLRSAKKHHVQLDILEIWHQPIPDIRTYHGLIVLGGSPNVNQVERYPFLKAEKEVIRRAVYNDMPYLGFCLGHQLLAEAVGARVGPNFCRSVGFIQGQVTKNGCLHPIFRGIPKSFIIFKWHSQVVLPPLPKHVQVLATSADCEIEAISMQEKPHLIGLQFDNHAAAPSDVKEWVESDQEWLSQATGADPVAILKDAEKLENILGEQFEILFNNFIKLM